MTIRVTRIQRHGRPTMFIIITLTYLYNRRRANGIRTATLGPAPLDHPDALLRRRYLRAYLSLARVLVLYARAKFRPLPSNNGDNDTTPLYWPAGITARGLPSFLSPRSF